MSLVRELKRIKEYERIVKSVESAATMGRFLVQLSIQRQWNEARGYGFSKMLRTCSSV